MKIKINTLLALVLSAAVLLPGLSSCQKEAEEKGESGALSEGAISFGMTFRNSPTVLETKGSFELKDNCGNSRTGSGNETLVLVENCIDILAEPTKSTLISDVAGFTSEYGYFKTSGYLDGSIFSDIEKKTVTHQTSKFSDGIHDKWTLSDIVYWPANTELEFFGWSPETTISNQGWPSDGPSLSPSGLSTPATASFSYSIDDPTTQADLLLGYYCGKGDDKSCGEDESCVAEMNFSHPLTSVKFKAVRGLVDIKVNSVTLSGVATAGSCIATLGSTHSYAWTVTETGDITYTFPEPINPSELESECPVFITIPEKFELGSTAKLIFNITDAKGDVDLIYDLADDSREEGHKTTNWEAGKTNVYIIGVKLESGIIITDIVEDNIKSNVYILNNGTATSWVRATIVGNWVDGDGNIIAQWTPDQGSFTGLPGYNWISKTSDGCTVYYYKDPVRPGDSIPDDLFTQYEAPESKIAGGHLEMEILVQGVIYDENKENVSAAWGSEIADELNILDSQSL